MVTFSKLHLYVYSYIGSLNFRFVLVLVLVLVYIWWPGVEWTILCLSEKQIILCQWFCSN